MPKIMHNGIAYGKGGKIIVHNGVAYGKGGKIMRNGVAYGGSHVAKLVEKTITANGAYSADGYSQLANKTSKHVYEETNEPIPEEVSDT